MALQGALTLEPVSLNSIPRSGHRLAVYLSAAIRSAYSFVDEMTMPPSKPWKVDFKKTNRYGEVEVASRVRRRFEGTEYWFARHSVHELDGEFESVGDRPDGLSWDDFANNLMRDHLQHEREYGPSVSRVDLISLDLNLAGVTVSGWRVVEVAAYAVHFQLPWPLKPRVFPILLIAALAASRREFLVISLPLEIPPDIKGTDISTQETVSVVGPKEIIGQYVAVERVLYQMAVINGTNPIVIWDMATASHASGHIPMTLQRRGIGDAIFKDVEAFLDYVKGKKTG
ncbi:hypothetical protein DRE_01075 [Drechslerella stenobrocha 248]|uniref:DUF3074 domain-containing protein n=1 Tax=Drechslerella stenobrocha 248 TaxID=1043628 RepID=W7HMB5_9PEZI|nr:hypothetical protein DRE_01075 [Drechslerella stenobrocha 248]